MINFMFYLSKSLQRTPWIVEAAYPIWRLILPRYTFGAVGIVICDGKVLLVEHVFHPKTPWGLPGGWVNRNESPAYTVERELLEELSLDVEVGPVVLLDSSYPNHMDIAYLCNAKNKIGQLSFELLNYRWFDPLDLPKIGKFNYRAIQSALAMLKDTEQKQ